jgi:energy-coupling factor transporter transmembrane protein EcfT
LVVASAAFLLWFLASAWAIHRASSVRHRLIRAVLYLGAFVLTCFVSLAPLFPAYGIFGVCRLGVECGPNAQGLFNVLNVVPFQLHLWTVAPLSLGFVWAALLLSRVVRPHHGSDA